MARKSKQTLYQRIALEGEEEVRAGLKALGSDGQAAFAALQRQARDAGRASSDLGKKLLDLRAGFVTVGDRARALGNNFSGLTRAAVNLGAAIAGAFSVRALVDLTTVWTDLNSQVRLVIDSGEDVSQVMERLGVIANRTYSDLQLTVEGFARNARVLNELGYSTQQQLNFQEALNNSLVVSGARGDRVRQVTDSIAKAMATGSLRGEELNNVLAFGGRIAELLAKHFNTTQGGLRQLAAEGRITGKVLFEVLTKNMQQLAREAESMPPTIADGFILIRNALLQFVGTADQASGVSAAIASALAWVAQNIQTVVIALGALLGAMLLIKGVALARDLIALGAALVQLVPKIAAVTVALLANPLTFLPAIIALAIAAIVGMYIYWEDFRNVVNAVGVAIGEFFTNLINGAQLTAQDIGNFFTSLAETITSTFNAILEPIKNAIDTIAGWVGDLIDLVGNLLDAIFGAKEASGGGGGGDGPAAQENAAGGHIRGPGTGTSDSILSWLSDGEYVIRASAVKKYGLGMLNALNGLRLPRFANGGLAVGMPRMSFAVPALASGGPVAAGRPLSLTLGGETFDGLIAPEQVASKLVQFATTKKMRSTGAKPGWKQ